MRLRRQCDQCGARIVPPDMVTWFHPAPNVKVPRYYCARCLGLLMPGNDKGPFPPDEYR